MTSSILEILGRKLKKGKLRENIKEIIINKLPRTKRNYKLEMSTKDQNYN